MNKTLLYTLIGINITLIALVIGLWISIAGNSTSQVSGNQDKADPKTGETSYHKNQVKNTIIKNSGSLQKCYAAFLEKKPEKIEGNIKIDWQITEDGKPGKVERIFNELGQGEASAMLETCAIDAIYTWEFPPPPGERNVYVAHKFYFGNPKSSAPEMVNVK